MEHRFKLAGEEVIVTVTQTKKTVWVASGDFEGSAVQVKGTSAKNALDHWRNVALRQAD